ncbi:MAG: flippase-like domain-containing protein [Acidimicrobiales bacterium]|nr:flippase-like domain-containing protein [Acidimicrobiales bacterium]
MNQITDLDLEELSDELADATWWLAAVGFVVAQAPRLAQALSTLGAATHPIALRPLYLLQLAQSYIGLAVPTSAARIAMSVRFFQKQGFSAGSSLGIGGLDSFAGFLVEATLLTGLLLLKPPSLDFDLDAPSLPDWGTVLLWLTVLAVVLGTVSLLLPDHRRQFTGWARNLATDGRDTLRGLSGRRIGLLVGGNLASVLLFSLALGLFARSLGTSVSFADLVVIIIGVSLLAGLLPIPGGIGVVEGGLTFGLVAAGMPEGPAFAAVLLYRLASFYLPPVWGFFAFRSLERNGYL